MPSREGKEGDSRSDDAAATETVDAAAVAVDDSEGREREREQDHAILQRLSEYFLTEGFQDAIDTFIAANVDRSVLRVE